MILTLLFLQIASVPAGAAAAPVCPATPAALPKDLASWSAKGDDLASMRAITLPTKDLATPRVVDVPLPTGRAASRSPISA